MHHTLLWIALVALVGVMITAPLALAERKAIAKVKAITKAQQEAQQ